MAELKPCPFCGGEATVFVSSGGVCVLCTKCRCQTPVYCDEWIATKTTNSVRSVTDRWNRRAEDGK